MTSPLTAEGTLVGTFQYLAPELLEGAAADARSDLFALGIEIGSSNRYRDMLIARWNHQQLPEYVREFNAGGDPARIEPLLASVPSSP